MTDLFSFVVLMAPPGGESGQGGGPSFFIFLGLFFLIIYFFMIRPQTKKAKEQKNFINELKKGDKVVTIGGIHGKILEVSEDSYLLEVDANVKLRFDKSAISLDLTRNVTDKSGKKDAK